MAEQEAEETQAEEPQHASFALLTELPNANATLEGFEEGLDFPATFPGTLDDLGRAWHGRDDEAPFLSIAFFGWQPDPSHPKWHPRKIVQLDLPA